MRIVVHVLLYLEGGTGLLHADADVYVQVLLLLCGSLVILAAHVELGIICVLYVCALVLGVEILVNAVLYKVRIQLIHEPVFTCKVNHRTGLHLAVHHKE